MSIEIDRTTFMNELQKLKDYADYKKELGSAPAQAFGLMITEELLKCQDKHGVFMAGAGKAEKDKAKITPKSVFKLKDEKHKKQLFDTAGTMLMGDVMLSKNRLKYIADLMGKAKKGDLSKQLDKNLEPEDKYYKAPSKAPDDVNVEKAKQWLKKGVTGSTAEYDKAVDGNLKKDGKFPLGADEKIIYGIWKKLVTDAPDWRSFNPATPYPSSVGGMCVLKKVLADLGKEKMPKVGEKAWEDWALFFFGAAMTAQPFPDGNKRACRAAYAIIMANAGIPFRAPTDKFGSQLGAMM